MLPGIRKGGEGLSLELYRIQHGVVYDRVDLLDAGFRSEDDHEVSERLFLLGRHCKSCRIRSRSFCLCTKKARNYLQSAATTHPLRNACAYLRIAFFSMLESKTQI